MRGVVFIGKVSTWVWAERLEFFHLKGGTSGSDPLLACPRRMAGRIVFFCHAMGAWFMP